MSDQAPPVEQQFGLQRLYTKDVSFETPQGPALFQKAWKPEVHQELATRTVPLEDDLFEVVLTVTITGKLDGQPAFVVEVHQAGIFLIKGLTADQVRQVTGTTCPNVLFPYAREVVDSLMVRGTLPPLMLPPINFDALYQQALAQQTEQAGGTAH
ncbi:MAG TPA: protein-export chaperone SecB [Pseudomonadales bacterium]|nr:protein-export chaperone SecB [Pseudomonadales bacterium]